MSDKGERILFEAAFTCWLHDPGSTCWERDVLRSCKEVLWAQWLNQCERSAMSKDMSTPAGAQVP